MKRINTEEQILRLASVETTEQANVDKNQWQYEYVRGNTDFSQIENQDESVNQQPMTVTDPLTGEIHRFQLNLSII